MISNNIGQVGKSEHSLEVWLVIGIWNELILHLISSVVLWLLYTGILGHALIYFSDKMYFHLVVIQKVSGMNLLTRQILCI